MKEYKYSIVEGPHWDSVTFHPAIKYLVTVYTDDNSGNCYVDYYYENPSKNPAVVGDMRIYAVVNPGIYPVHKYSYDVKQLGTCFDPELFTIIKNAYMMKYKLAEAFENKEDYDYHMTKQDKLVIIEDAIMLDQETFENLMKETLPKSKLYPYQLSALHKLHGLIHPSPKMKPTINKDEDYYKPMSIELPIKFYEQN